MGKAITFVHGSALEKMKRYEKKEIQEAITELMLVLNNSKTDFYPHKRNALRLAIDILQEILKKY